jgi:hypothetical protein
MNNPSSDGICSKGEIRSWQFSTFSTLDEQMSLSGHPNEGSRAVASEP